MKIFAVYDSKAEAFLPPWVAKTTAVALRRFEATAQNPESDFAQFGADYTLFELGDWLENTGEIRLNEAKHNLGTALQFHVNDSPTEFEHRAREKAAEVAAKFAPKGSM